jgi:hypothetical protein
MKHYDTPTLTELTREQAKLKLVAFASNGDQRAKDFLDKMFPDTAKKPASSESCTDKGLRRGHS